MIQRAWRRVLEELGWQGVITLAVLAGPMAGYVLIWGVWPLYQRLGFGVLAIVIAVVMGRERRREERKKEQIERVRNKALRIVERLELQGKGLESATLEELHTIRRGLNGEDGT
jgi:membrane protein implicated in regulation of membrane protease activity